MGLVDFYTEDPAMVPVRRQLEGASCPFGSLEEVTNNTTKDVSGSSLCGATRASHDKLATTLQSWLTFLESVG